ncbi:hydrogenase expression/formation protein HypE [bacterium]|nr:hydrogenase expression/formation protein HypE [bacterium]
MTETPKITISHGSGGKLTHELIKTLFLEQFNAPQLAPLNDSAIIDINGQKLAFTTDSYVVNPLFFPGGDIGKLAICGTVNDLSVMGAKPLFISCGYIIEEGLEYDALARITRSAAEAAQQAGAAIVTGDTKVVEHGKGDGIFINTSGVGICEYELPGKIETSDKVLVSGPIGDHEVAILVARGGLDFQVEIKSDCAPLWDLISKILSVSNKIKFMRDPTRGGLATVLNELVENKEYGIQIEEASIPISEKVNGVCSLLGFDPLYLANEGKVVVVVSSNDAMKVLDAMKGHALGDGAALIGEVVAEPAGLVAMKTKVGGRRVVDMLVGTQLPRIC